MNPVVELLRRESYLSACFDETSSVISKKRGKFFPVLRYDAASFSNPSTAPSEVAARDKQAHHRIAAVQDKVGIDILDREFSMSCKENRAHKFANLSWLNSACWVMLCLSN